MRDFHFAKMPVVKYLYNRYGYASDTRDHIIELYIHFNKKSKFISTGIRVFPREWKNGFVTNRPDAVQLNRFLDKLMADARKVLNDMVEEGRVDIHAVPERLKRLRIRDVDFVSFCKDRAKIKKYGKAEDTQDRYDRFFRFLESYGKIQSFSDLTEAKIIEMDRFLQKKNNMKAKSRWHNYHRFLNSFIIDAQKERLIDINPYDRVKMDKGEDYDGLEKFLTLEEFQRLRTTPMPEARLERVRDLFVFHCYFCQGYHDLAAFDVKKIKAIDGKKVYTGKRGKTGIDFTVPLLSPALAILEKYQGKLPMLSNVKYNDYLKEVATAAGIEKNLTTHWARHTGGTLLLNAGVPMGVVSRVLGHSSIKMTERIYAKYLPKTIVDEVMKIEDKIV